MPPAVDESEEESLRKTSLTQRKLKSREGDSSRRGGDVSDEEGEDEEGDCGGGWMLAGVLLGLVTLIVVLVVVLSSGSAVSGKKKCGLSGDLTPNIDLGGGVSGSTHLVTHGA